MKRCLFSLPCTCVSKDIVLCHKTVKRNQFGNTLNGKCSQEYIDHILLCDMVISMNICNCYQLAVLCKINCLWKCYLNKGFCEILRTLKLFADSGKVT